MTTLTEGRHAGEFIVSEAEGSRARELITIDETQNLSAGAVLGRILGAISTAGTNTGNGTVGSITVGMQTEIGDYLLKCTSTGPGVASAGTSAAGTNTGDGTMTASPATGAGAKVGTYVITCIEPATNAGKFIVEDPDGINIGVATVGVAFTTQITFTISDGSTDFVSGDKFTVVVAAANSGTFSVRAPSGVYLANATVGTAYTSLHLGFTIADGSTDFAINDTFTVAVVGGNYTELDTSATDGSQRAAGILFDNCDATDADTVAVAIVRDEEINSGEIEWPDGISDGNKAIAAAQLNALGIILR